MTPTEQDKELEAQLDKIFPCNCSFIKGFAFKPGDPCDGSCVNAPYRRAVLQLITADRKRVALEARLDEMKLHRHEWALFGDRPPYKGESVSLPILLAYHDDRIDQLQAQQEEV